MVTVTPHLPVTSLYFCATFSANLAIPTISSSVSVGSPIMKYSLTCFQPCLKAASTAPMRFSSVTPLLITSRSLWVPASGAKVRPLFLTCCILCAKSMEKLSMRKDGREKLTFSSLKSANRSSTSSPRQE